jgi:hypothetical protein
MEGISNKYFIAIVLPVDNLVATTKTKKCLNLPN